MFFGFGLFEILIIAAVFCACFGVRRARQTAREMGRIHAVVQRVRGLLRNPFRLF